LAAVSSPATDTFNDLPLDVVASPLQRTVGAYGYQASTSAQGFLPAGTDSDVWLSTNFENDAITFSGFTSNVRAFGGSFFGSDLDGAFLPGETFVLSATDGATTSTFTLESIATTTFVGFVSSNPLASVTLNSGAIPGSLVYGTANDVLLAVPEPTSWGMLLAGLCVVGFVTRRRPV
jgi:hypothetical protein